MLVPLVVAVLSLSREVQQLQAKYSRDHGLFQPGLISADVTKQPSIVIAAEKPLDGTRTSITLTLTLFPLAVILRILERVRRKKSLTTRPYYNNPVGKKGRIMLLPAF